MLLAINGRDVQDPQGMAFRLATLRIGDEAKVTVMRKGEQLELPVELTPAPREPEPDETVLEGQQPLTGAKVANLSPALGEELSVSGWKGVVIVDIKRGSFARSLGLRPGDIIARINGTRGRHRRAAARAGLGRAATTWESDGRTRRQGQDRHGALRPCRACSKHKRRGRWPTGCARSAWRRSSARIT